MIVFLLLSPFVATCSEGYFKLIIPREGEIVIAKKPLVKVRFSLEIVPASLMVILDETDITQLIDISKNEFTYQSFQILPAGDHSITFFGTTKEGKEIQETYNFSTKHSQLFTEAYTEADLSSVGEACIKLHQESKNLPGAKLEGNINLNSIVSRENIFMNSSLSVRYFDQDIPVDPPLKKGFDIAGFYLNGEYRKNSSRMKMSLGDVQIRETSLTIDSLFQKGVLLTYSNGPFYFDVFSVTDPDTFNFSKDYITGLGGHSLFLNDKLSLRVAGASGRRAATFWSPAQSGDVFGLLLEIVPWEEKLKMELENAYTRFDADISDEFGKIEDKAFKFKISGMRERFYYEIFYDFIGEDFQSIGNQYLPKDEEGGGFNLEMNMEKYSIGLSLSRYQDNVENSPLFPTVESWDAAFNSSFNEMPNLPWGFSYQFTSQKDKIFPSDFNQITNSLLLNINYFKDLFQTSFQIGYNLMDDKTKADNDTYITNYFLNFSYLGSKISFFPSFCLDKSRDKLTDVTTDSFTTNLDITFSIFKGLNSNIRGSYTSGSSSDGMFNSQNTNVQLSFSYPLSQLLQGMMKPSLYLKGEYRSNEDKIAHLSTKDFGIFLGVEAQLTSSF